MKAAGKKLLVLLVVGLLIATSVGTVFAQENPAAEPVSSSTEVVSPYLILLHTTYADGTELEGALINGPSKPPAEFEADRQASIEPLPATGVLSNFPSFSWVFGCSAVSSAMIATYYDRGAFPKLYTGPTAGGKMPLSDTSWPTWTDGYSTYPNNPLIASHKGVDGRTTKGSIDDYWIKYGSTLPDPYITGGWTQLSWGTAVGDFMKTSQSKYSSTDGGTWFWTNGSAKFQCSDMPNYNSGFGWGKISDFDGTYGRKLFYQARGYTVTDCYSQSTDNKVAGGFSLANFQAQIDSGNPVLLNLAGHSIVGYGYSGSTIYIRDTWDNNTSHTYTMPWGGSYAGMELRSVSIVRLKSGTPTGGFNSQFTSNASGWTPVKGVWSVGSGYYKTSSKMSTGFASSKHANTYGVLTYTAKINVNACNSCGIMFNGTPAPVTDNKWNKGYSVYLSKYLNYSIFSYSGGVATAIQTWTSHSAIKSGWNIIKITYNQANGFFQLFINNTKIGSGYFNQYKSGQVGLAFAGDGSTFQVDYAVLTTTAPKSAGMASDGVIFDESAAVGGSSDTQAK